MTLKQLRAFAQQGDARAQFNLGAMYRNGQGVPQDDALAAAWTRKATDQGLLPRYEDFEIAWQDA